MSAEIVVFRRRFIVVRRISMPVCSEKGTSHCLVHKEESKKRDSDERNYFPRAKKSERRGAHERRRERVAKSRLEDEEEAEEDAKVKENVG